MPASSHLLQHAAATAITLSSSGGSQQPRSWSSIVGIVTAIVGNILISFALNTQRYAHIRIDREYKDNNDPEAKAARKSLPKSLRRYGAIVEQEEAAEERQRVNEAAEHGENSHENHGASSGSRRQSDSTLRPKEDGEDESSGRKSYLKSPYWWLGLCLMTIGETGNFLAYGFAPASIVSPLGVVGLISNCLIAPLMLKETFRQRDFWGVLVAIGGAVTVVLSAKTSEKRLGPGSLLDDIERWEFLAYVLITVVFIVALMIASPKYGKSTILIDLGLVGLFGGYTALSTKGVASLLSASLYRAFTYPIFYFLVVILFGSAIMQIRYLNRGLQNFDSTQVIPVQFVMFTLSTIIGSAVLYRDFERTDLDHALKFVFGCLLTFGGVYLITSGRKNNNEEEEESDAGEDEIRLLDEETTVDERTPLKREGSTVNGKPAEPITPPTDRTQTAAVMPTIALTPAEDAMAGIQSPAFVSSTGSSDRADSRPVTPPAQIVPESSQTPFFTPASRMKQKNRLERTISSPAQPETPSRTSTSPPKPDLPDAQDAAVLRPGHTRMGSISRLLPGPILQPLSSSLSGIIADRILHGEGTPSPRLSLRRHRSHRETTRRGSVQPDSFTIVTPGANSSDTRLAIADPSSPLLARSGVSDAARVPGSLKGSKGRLRSMSETLSGLMERARGKTGSADGPSQKQGHADRSIGDNDEVHDNGH